MTSSIKNSCEELLKQGQKVQAIKMWREHTGTSLKEAKDIIEYFEDHGVWLEPNDLPPEVTVQSDLIDSEDTTHTMTDVEIQAECAHLVNNGEKIAAIKMWRQHTNASLRDAKAQIEHFEATNSWSKPPPPSSPPNSQEHQHTNTEQTNTKSKQRLWFMLAVGILLFEVLRRVI